jgi:hypothetical protein
MRHGSMRAALTALVAVSALVLSACTSAPTLSDPKEILTKAVDAAMAAKTFHLEATVSGKINADLTGSGSATSLTVDGTSLTGDLDIAGKKARIQLSVPALLGLTADIIQIGEDSYAKTSLTGDKYQHSVSTSSSLPVDPADPAKTLEDLKAWLDKPEVSPTKGSDVTCDGTSCYQVTIELTAAELTSLGAADASMDPNSLVTLVFHVRKDNNHLATVKATVDAGTQGNLALQLDLTKWDESVSITAPPADQVTESGSPLLP